MMMMRVHILKPSATDLILVGFFLKHIRTITHIVNCLVGITINYGYGVFGVLLSRMKLQMDPKNSFSDYSYIIQTDLPEDTQHP